MPAVDSLRQRQRFVGGLLAANVVADLVSITTSVSQLNFLTGAYGDQGSEATADLFDAADSTIGQTQFGLMLASGVAFLAWIHRAHFNLTLGGLRDLVYTPGKAVIGFFIPIMNLVRPYRVVKEIWAGSVHLASGAPLRSWGQNPITASLIDWWWFAFLASSILARVYRFQTRHATGVDDMIGVTQLGMVCDVSNIAAAFLAAVLVHRVTGMQEDARIRLLAARSR
jgi:hypothetical protein